ncbi:MAG: hypothetical protein KME45_32655 [Stenomitos rutilans HA7619-LM2]|jgi:2'-5' RNA ligase|nr:hypothetical protein [Stenomitos rutilans HA7619-LM2]
MKFGIAMIPNSEMIEAIAQLQKQATSICPLQPELGSDRNLPHITLLQGRFHDSVDWMQLLTELRDYYVNQQYDLSLQLTELECKALGWYFLIPSRNPFFYDAHQFVFQRLKAAMFLTESDRQKDVTHYSSLEQSNYLTYGYRFIGDAFQPHITLGRVLNPLTPENQARIRDLVETLLPLCSNMMQKLTVYRQGEYGSHADTLCSIELEDGESSCKM